MESERRDTLIRLLLTSLPAFQGEDPFSPTDPGASLRFTPGYCLSRFQRRPSSFDDFVTGNDFRGRS